MSKSDIEAAENKWLQAFNGGDAAGVAALYEQDARLMAPNLETLQGRPALEAFCKEFIQTGAQLAFRLLTVHETPDVCAAVGVYDMKIPGAPDDKGKYIEVWRRQADGSWLIADDIFNSDLPAPAG